MASLRSLWEPHHVGRGAHLLIQPVGHDGRRLVLLGIADGPDPQRNLWQQR